LKAERKRGLSRRLESMIARWEKEYRLERARELQDLHNEIVDLFGKYRIHVPEIICLLEILKHEYISERLKQIIEEGKPIEEAMK